MSAADLIAPVVMSCTSAVAFSVSTRSFSRRFLKPCNSRAAAASAAETPCAALLSRNCWLDTRRPLGRARRRPREPSSSMTSSMSSSSAQPSSSSLVRPRTARAAARPAAMPASPSISPARKEARATVDAEGVTVVRGEGAGGAAVAVVATVGDGDSSSASSARMWGRESGS
eukprot:7387991-Prymnesium_polylepis.2